MPIKRLKTAEKSPATGEDNTREVVQTMLREIEAGGEERVRQYARELDKWEGDITVARADIEAAGAALPARMKQDIEFAHARIKKFAEAQLESLRECSTELSPGLHA